MQHSIDEHLDKPRATAVLSFMPIERPSFQDWLGAQVHREDMIGSIARQKVTQIEKVKALGFDCWLAGLVAGGVLGLVVDDARREYARCLEELMASGHSESWPLSLHNQPNDEEQSARWEKHRTEPHVSFEKFHHELHKALRKRVERVCRLYLDTCHWVRLRDVILGRPAAPVYVALLAKLRELKASDKILCPLSYPMYHELAKQSDDKTRRTMARLMDELSEGICIQPPNQLERIELKRQMLRAVLGPGAPDVGEWLWVKASGVFGEMIPIPKANWTPEEVTLIQKVVFEGLWNLPISAVAEFYQEKTAANDLTSLAEAYNTDARKYREQKVPFERVWHEEMANLFQLLRKNHFVNTAKEVWDQFPDECAMVHDKGMSMQPDPMCLATLQIKARLHAAFFVSSGAMKFESNDLIDALHASVSLPYFDAVLLERPLAIRLKTKPLELDKAYSAKIMWDPSELLQWLTTK